MDLPVKSFQEQLNENLQARDELAKKLDVLLKNDGDPVEIAQAALAVIETEQVIILALSAELNDETVRPKILQAKVDERSVAEIKFWKQQFESLQARFQQYQQTHF